MQSKTIAALPFRLSGRTIGWGIRFFAAAALTAGKTAEGYAPFALGLIAAAGGGANGAAALLGAALGAVLFLEFADGLAFLAVGILIVTTATAFRDTALLRHPATMPILTGSMVLAVEGIYVMQALSPVDKLTPCFAAASLAAGAAWIFCTILNPTDRRPAADGLLLLAAILLLSIGEVELLHLSVGRVLLSVLLIYITFDREKTAGITAGLGLGLAADLCAASGSGIFTAAYGLGCLLASGRRGRFSASAAFLAGVAAAALPSRTAEGVYLLMEAGAGAILFLLLPGRIFGGKRVLRAESEKTAVSERWRERLQKASAALRDLYESVGRNVPQIPEENPAVIFDRSAERVCRDCTLCKFCWQKEYTATFNAMNDATPYLLERGRAMAKDFPRYFADRCIHFTELLAAINVEIPAFLLRKQYRRQLEKTRKDAKGQYAQLSDLLTAAASGPEAAPVSGDSPPITVGAVLRPREGEAVCGDTVISFCTDSGVWCLLLADGMGSGEAARKESAMTCRLLRQFLEAEIDPEASLKTLNSAMALRGAETGSFTTVDLCVCRSDTGETGFYKFGAASSYIKRKGSVQRITGSSLPVGMRGVSDVPDVTHALLEEGSFAVMISDGVADPGQDDWLQNLLAGWEEPDPQSLAEAVMQESIRIRHLQDDCAVQVLYRGTITAKRV